MENMSKQLTSRNEVTWRYSSREETEPNRTQFAVLKCVQSTIELYTQLKKQNKTL